MSVKKGNKRNLAISLLLLALTTVGIGFFLIVSPKQLDDYWFGRSLKTWFESNGINGIDCGWEVLKSGFPISGIIDTWVEHMNIDCGRLSNLAMMFVLVLPKWVGSGIALFFWMVCMYFSLRLARVKISRSPWLTGVAVFCWSFQIGWTQFMGSLALQYNYLLPSGLMIWYIWVVCDKEYRRIGYFFLLFAGIVVGAWHEGFTVSVLAGALMVVLFYKDYRVPKYYMSMAGLLTGFIFLMLCPGLDIRIGAHKAAIIHSPLFFAICVTLGHITYFIILIWTVILICKGRKAKVSPLVMFALVSGAVSLFLQIYMKEERRVGWWMDVISIIALLEMLGTLRWHNHKSKRMLQWSSVIILGILTISHWIAVDYYTYIWSREQSEILSVIRNGDSKYVFVNIKTPRQLPVICGWTPYNNLMHAGLGRDFMNEYFFEEDYSRHVRVLPESMRKVTATTGRAVPGGSGVREVDGNMYCDVSLIKFLPGTLDYLINSDIVMSTGLKGEGNMWITRFVSEADGKEYFYLEPNEVNLKVLFGEIVRIENLRSCW